ncbi:MAG TPA: ATP-binding protein [Nocardioidaceae bacterium]|nr:ATP-binding protein [Nocardioidaceae bacterium]
MTSSTPGPATGHAAGSAAGVTVAITRDPALVRTVRLVAAAVARRTGRDEEFVEEVRLAVGEACALLIGEDELDAGVATSAGAGSPPPSEEPEATGAGAAPVTGDATAPVHVAISINDELQVEVSSAGPVAVEDDLHSDVDGVEPWALLRGLIGNFGVTRDGGITRVSMAWPLA